ncbi:MAG: hypothetical protein COT15_02990 [Candidatus Diapherotrites archaeon CG08_land_8_20_14_0_20_34_12]|nr:MAG: hypothetical protein COT15_02990 [Candidatus Diapherotrites archaeon CG08_land_8_20_14_0_20_34_12]
MLKLSLLNLFRRKSRTFLSLLGITIGVGTLIAMVAVVDGTYSQFNSLIAQFQGLSIMEKDSANQTLSKLDITLKDKLENVQGVRTVLPEIWLMPTSIDGKSLSLESMTSTPPFIYGVDTMEYTKMRGNGWIGELDKGKKLQPSDNKKAMIGAKVAETYDKFVGSSIKLGDKTFEVVGIMKNESSLMETIIVIPLDDARIMSALPVDKVNSYYVELENAKDDGKIKKIIEFKYGNELDASTSSDYSDQFSSVLGNFRMVVILVGLLAAIVSAIGVINTMLMNVMERKREIGTLKAGGWSSIHIIKMILIEAALIGVIGALLGLLLGLSLTYILNILFGLDSVITQELLTQSALFAIGLSLFAGLYPAYRAAKLDPVEAMTY